MSQPKRHKGSERRYFWPRENWYRDVWLLLITALSLFGVVLAVRHADDFAKQRLAYIYATCKDTDQKHNKTIAQLNKLAKMSARESPAQLSRLFSAAGISINARQRKALAAYEISQVPHTVKENTALINQFVPYKNCSAFLRKAEHPKPIPPMATGK